MTTFHFVAVHELVRAVQLSRFPLHRTKLSVADVSNICSADAPIQDISAGMLRALESASSPTSLRYPDLSSVLLRGASGDTGIGCRARRRVRSPGLYSYQGPEATLCIFLLFCVLRYPSTQTVVPLRKRSEMMVEFDMAYDVPCHRQPP